MRNRAFIIPASAMRRDQDFALPVGFSGISGMGDYSEMPGTYGGLVPGGCACNSGGLVAQGLEGWVKAHPFLALGVAGLIGYSFAGSKRGRR